jgi:hypothetical protein
MSSARRDFLKFAGGAGLGLVASPVPWKLLDDSAIWTQNWSWTPKLARGEVSWKPTACTLCPRGCAISVRCLGDQPVGVKPRAGSTLCARGVRVHQAAYWPERLRHTSSAADEALSFARHALRQGRRVAILDPAPGRAASHIYRRFVAATPGAVYIAASAPTTLRAYEHQNNLPFQSACVALDEVRTVIAAEAPVLENWAAPGRLMRRRDAIRVVYGGVDGGITADIADECVPLSAVPRIAAEAEKPALVVGGEHLPWARHLELAALNRGLGAIRIRRGMNEGAEPPPIDSIEAGSIGLAIVDGPGVPLQHLAAKLRPDCTIIAISAFANEYTSEAKFVVAAPAPLEALDDVPASFDARCNSLHLAPALVTAPPCVSAGDFVGRLANEGGVTEAIDRRIAAIHASRRGTARGTTLEDFRTMLFAGGAWTDGGVA